MSYQKDTYCIVADKLDYKKYDYKRWNNGIKVSIPMSSKIHYNRRGNEKECSKTYFYVDKSYGGAYYIKKYCECCDRVEEELYDVSYDDMIKLVDKYLNTNIDRKSAITMIKNIIDNISDR